MMEEAAPLETNDYGTDNEAVDYAYGYGPSLGTERIAGHVVQLFNIIFSLCLVLTIIVHKKLRGNPNNWPIVYYGMTLFLCSVFNVAFEYYNDFQIARNIDPRFCVFFRVLVVGTYEAFVLAQLFLLIDRVDWLADTTRHDKRMTSKSYGITIAVLVVVGFVISMAFFARPEPDHLYYGCVNDFDHFYRAFNRIEDIIQTLAFLAIFIAALIVYKKRPAADENAGGDAEARETTIIVCTQSGVTMVLITIQFIFTATGTSPNTLNLVIQVFIGFTCLLMLGVFSKLRHGFLCRTADTSGEKVPLL